MPSLTFGDWSVHTLETGFLGLDGGSMFGPVPKPLWSRMQPPDERNRIRLAMRCLLLEGHGRRVLVDDGIGAKFGAKLADIYAIDQREHTLERALEDHGLGVGDVTDVLLTHLHFDHAGGSTRLEGERLVPRLPNARYYVQRRNLENARDPNPRERASYLSDNFKPLDRAGVLTLWDGPGTPWPGVEVFTADGHMRGQQLVRSAKPVRKSLSSSTRSAWSIAWILGPGRTPAENMAPTAPGARGTASGGSTPATWNHARSEGRPTVSLARTPARLNILHGIEGSSSPTTA